MDAPEVRIEGDGVAALCCAHLLTQSGIGFALLSSTTARQPAILLGSQAVSLLRDVCGSELPLKNGWRIVSRVVQWGEARQPVTVAHDGIAIPESRLIEGMSETLQASPFSASASARWTIATRQTDAAAAYHSYGQRRAISCRVEMKDSDDARSCWIESTEDGWLFLLPYGQRNASMIVAGKTPENVLKQSRLIAPRVEIISQPSASVSIAPRLAQVLCSDGMILTGSAAMRFDPLCGEGAGHAVREAYLAVAVLRAASRGEPAGPLLDHYMQRLQQGFLRHLAICSSFYGSGGDGSFWREENSSLQEGIAAIRPLVEQAEPSEFRFRGLDLERVAEIAGAL